jgi:hypothetical protein
MKDEFLTREELLNAFRTKEQKNVIIPTSMKFPISLGHYLVWQEPSGVRLYLVFKKPEWKSAVGISFRRDQTGSTTSPPGICDWCIHIGPSDEVGLLTATVNSKVRVGINLCLDLSCIDKLEINARLAGKSFDKMVEKLKNNMSRFCKEALGIEGK